MILSLADRTWLVQISGMGSQPKISEIRDFVARAKSVGIFKKTHVTNVLQALKTATEQATANGENPETWTVKEFRDRIPDLFQAYGGANNVSTKSVSTYQKRVLKLLKQFEQHHDDDDVAFHQWKSEVEAEREARKSRRKKNPKTKSSAVPTREPEQPDAAELEEGTHVVSLPLRGGRRVSLTSPIEMTLKETEIVQKWIEAQLTAAAALAALRSDDEEDDIQ